MGPRVVIIGFAVLFGHCCIFVKIDNKRSSSRQDGSHKDKALHVQSICFGLQGGGSKAQDNGKSIVRCQALPCAQQVQVVTRNSPTSTLPKYLFYIQLIGPNQTTGEGFLLLALAHGRGLVCKSTRKRIC